jgi:hypothetical protein
MKIIYAQSNGVLAVLAPAPKFLAELAKLDADGNDTVSIENKLIHIANKNLPTGTKYEIVADNVPPL